MNKKLKAVIYYIVANESPFTIDSQRKMIKSISNLRQM